MDEPRRRWIVASVMAPALVGMIGLFTLISRPRFQIYYTVDVLQLLASGACFGVALAGTLRMRRGSSSR